ncbi:glycosyltransferase involved in cell wall biosynthesis [Chryseomicrobium aureum]|uniref:glycosyltransferase n=1 Tax=Chryseomicrobium aureum TaxID=1441723 RepID=UPI00195C0EF4|nr:glycosyltransferase [Chryseomicrobium aureum]MBM7706082.1 glycosyltransferase involved in cell wall biosynthesis [Chryseomicrobium aureum]
MKLLYISSATTELKIKHIIKKYLNGKNFKTPQQTFDLSIAKGLANFANNKVISIPSVPSYPQSHKLFINLKKDIVSEELEINYMKLINISILKSIHIFINSLIEIIKFSKESIANRVVILHWPLYPTMLSAFIAKKIFKIKVILIVPDLPEYSSSYNTTGFKGLIIKSVNKIKPNIINKFDGYVLLTEPMIKKINILSKPYVIMEGLVSEEQTLSNNLIKRYDKPIVLYTGAIYKKYGLESLVRGFTKYVEKDAELWIYGEGDYVEELKMFSLKHPQIKYFGVAFRTEILEIQRKCTLLVNPRPSNEEFTKFSFPSKTLEYMASGTPVISTRLKGIPKEYDSFLYWFETESEEGFGKKINEVLENDIKDLIRFGENSKEWVLKNKNYLAQTQKIKTLIEELNN